MGAGRYRHQTHLHKDQRNGRRPLLARFKTGCHHSNTWPFRSHRRAADLHGPGRDGGDTPGEPGLPRGRRVQPRAAHDAVLFDAREDGIAIITLLPFNIFGSKAEELEAELETVAKNVQLLTEKSKRREARALALEDVVK